MQAPLRLAACALLLPSALAASLCTGIVGAPPDGDPTVCCAKGCGPSKEQCQETPDVCGPDVDATTQADCCPSIIKDSAVSCTSGWGTSCLLSESGLVEAPKAITTSSSLAVAAGASCVSRLPPDPAKPNKDSTTAMCSPWCKGSATDTKTCAWCKCRTVCTLDTKSSPARTQIPLHVAAHRPHLLTRARAVLMVQRAASGCPRGGDRAPAAFGQVITTTTAAEEIAATATASLARHAAT